jgi:hypothetical protein
MERNAPEHAATANPEDWQKLKRKFEDVRAIDFFGVPGWEEFESFMQSIERQLRGVEPRTAAKPDLALWVALKPRHPMLPLRYVSESFAIRHVHLRQRLSVEHFVL